MNSLKALSSKITFKTFSIFLIFSGFLLGIWFLWKGGFIQASFIPSVIRARDIQPFMTGIVAPLFALAGTLLVFENLRNQTSQQLSAIFFGMINLHHKIADNIKHKIEGISDQESYSQNRVFFDDLAFRIAIDYNGQDLEYESTDGIPRSIKALTDEIYYEKQGIEKLNAIYFYNFHIYQSALGHYFRNLFHIVTFIEESNIPKKEKTKYTKILRAQLSNYEILLLAYNCMSVYGEEFKPLVEKYKLLKNLNFEDNLSDKHFNRTVDCNVWISQFPHLEKEFKKGKKPPAELNISPQIT